MEREKGRDRSNSPQREKVKDMTEGLKGGLGRNIARTRAGLTSKGRVGAEFKRSGWSERARGSWLRVRMVR
jgi:hypothetical protein